MVVSMIISGSNTIGVLIVVVVMIVLNNGESREQDYMTVIAILIKKKMV